MTPEEAALRVCVAAEILQDMVPYRLHTSDWGRELNHPQRQMAVKEIGEIVERLSLINFALTHPEAAEQNKTLEKKGNK